METFSALLAFFEGNLPVIGEFPITKASDVKLSLIFAWTNGGGNNRYAGDLRRQYAHYDVILGSMVIH